MDGSGSTVLSATELVDEEIAVGFAKVDLADGLSPLLACCTVKVEN